MKTILVLISIMILGLYSCEKESTSAIQEEKKYTLEEILADTNWVEITDTIYIPTWQFLGYSYLNTDWELNTLKVIKSRTEYYDIDTKSDTSAIGYTKNNLNLDIDFNARSIIGIKIEISRRDKVYRKLFVNNIINQYQYFAIDTDSIRQLDGEQDYNFIIIPKLKNNYKIYGDYLYLKGYK